MTKTPTKNNRFSATALIGFSALILSIVFLTPKSAHSIVRVQVAPEVGRHVFQLDLGGTGSFEELAGDKGLSWSAGWTYHADNTLGLGVTVGKNKPESSVLTSAPSFLDYDYTYVTATIHVRAPTRSAFIPHLQAGFGKYYLNVGEFDILTNSQLFSAEVDDFGMFFGFGIDYLVAPSLSVGFVGNYHFISIGNNNLGLGEWYDTWDLKAVVSFYTR
jgi:Outer membrane protein beta-barrel domain